MDDPAPDMLRAWVDRRDERSLASLIDLHRGMVAGICRRVLGDGLSADEAAQEAFAALSMHGASIRGHPGPWLRRTALNAALHRRRDRLARASELAKDGGAVIGMAEADGEREQLLALVDECVEQLDEADRSLIVGLFYRSLSQQEVARNAGVSQARISQRLEGILERLRRSLRGRGISVQRSVLVATLLGIAGGASGQVGALSGASAFRGKWLAVGVGTIVLAGMGVGITVFGRAASMDAEGVQAGVDRTALAEDAGWPAGMATGSAAVHRPILDTGGAALHPLAVPPSADGEVWLAGGDGWNEFEWQVVVHELISSPEAASVVRVPAEIVRQRLPWRAAVGASVQDIAVGPVTLRAFPLGQTGPGTWQSLAWTDPHGVMRPDWGIRRRMVTCMRDAGGGWRWMIQCCDMVTVPRGAGWMRHVRFRSLGHSHAGPLPPDKMVSAPVDGLTGSISDFALIEAGVLIANPAIRRLREDEVADLVDEANRTVQAIEQ